MFRNYKVKVVIFAGRKKFMQIMIPSLQNNKFVDSILLCDFIKNENDREYIYALKSTYDKVSYLTLPDNYQQVKQKYPYLYNYHWYCFYSQTTDIDTIYIKLDDDIVYMSDDCIKNMIEARISNPQFGLIYATIINNPLSNLLFDGFDMQSSNVIQEMYSKFEDTGYVVDLHKKFLENHDKYILPTSILFNNAFCKKLPNKTYFIRPSINAICYFGFDMLRWTTTTNIVKFMYDDEQYLTNDIFDLYKIQHLMINNAIVSHFSFHDQVNALQPYEEEYLTKYATLMNIQNYQYC